MHVNLETINEASGVVEVKIDKNDFEPEVNKELKKYQHKAAVPGFRPGKAPFGMIKKFYGSQLIAETINRMVSDALNDHLSSNKIKVLGYPMADMQRTGTLDFDNNSSFSFFFNVALAPTLDIQLENITIDYPKVKVSDAEANEAIERMLADNPETTYPEVVGDDDTVELRCTQADADGNEVDGGYQATVVLNLKDIADADSKAMLVGKELGSEFVFNFGKALNDSEKVIRLLRLAEHDNHLVDEPFNVVVDEVRSFAPASMNETFFDAIFPAEGIKDEEAFRDKVKAVIGEQYDMQSDYLLFSNALKRILDETPMRFDHDILKQWIVENSQGSISMSDLEKDYANYERSVRYQLVEENLEEKHPELVVTRDEMRAYVASYFFRQFGMSGGKEVEKMISSTVDSILKDKKEANRIERQIHEQKMVKLFRSKLQLNVVEMSSEAFKSLVDKNNEETKEETND